MLDKDKVLDAIKEVKDPGTDRSLLAINCIRDVMIRDNRVNLTAILSEVTDEYKEKVHAEIGQALAKAGIESYHVRFREMTDIEKAEVLSGKTRGLGQRSIEGLDSMQARRQAELAAEGMPELLKPDSKTRFIAVASGKGGVGKSTVTANLAVALARKGKKVGIMDADIYGFSIPDMMGIDEKPALVDEKIIPIERFGVKVISMGFFVKDNAPVIWRGPMLGKMLRNFFQEVSWGEIDYMLLDLPPGTGDIALDVHQLIPQSKEILVTTPHATAAFVAARAGAMALQTNHEIVGVVENMSYYECGSCGTKDYVFGRGGGAKLAEEMKTDLLAQIPLGAPDNHPSEADYSPSVYKADTPTGQLYNRMAEQIIGKIG